MSFCLENPCLALDKIKWYICSWSCIDAAEVLRLGLAFFSGKVPWKVGESVLYPAIIATVYNTSEQLALAVYWQKWKVITSLKIARVQMDY